MARLMKLAAAITTVFLLCTPTPSATADAVLVPLDGSEKAVKPSDFGYQIDTFAVNRQVIIQMVLTDDAAKSFGFGQLTLMKGKKSVVETTLGLDRHAGGKKGILKLTLDPEAIDGGELILWSAEIKGQPLLANFGGFRFSIKTLLAGAKETEGK